MLKNNTYFFLLFCTFLIISSCTSTSPKDTSALWDDSDIAVNITPLVKPNLTGLWILNSELSNNSQTEVKQQMQKSSNSKANKSMNGRGNGDHRGNGKGKGGKRGQNYSRNKNNNPGRGSLPRELQALLNPSETLELKHDEPLLTILTKDGQDKVYTDFRSSSVSSNSNLNQKVTIAGWENNVLVVENTLSSGRFIQQFNLDSASGQLWISTSILTSHLPKPLKFRHVYEQVNSDEK